MHYGTGHDLLVVCCQQPTLAGVQMLVGLGTEAGDPAEGPAHSAFPLCAHGVGAILDHGDIPRVANLHDGVHVGDMPAHMGQHQEFGAAALRFGLQVARIEFEIFVDLDQDRTPARIVDGPWHG